MEALLIFETDEIWTVKLTPDFFDIDTTLVTFLDKYPEVVKRHLSTEDFPIERVFHAQTLKELIVAFVKSEGKIFLLQCQLNEKVEMVRHEVPPALSANGTEGDITAARFW